MKKFLYISGLLLAIVLFSTACTAAPPAPPDERNRVMVVQNLNSAASQSIARYYLSKRKIPVENLLSIRVPDSALNAANESIAYAQYQASIEAPVRDFARARSSRYIVLTKGVPIRVSDVPRPLDTDPNYRQTQSVDSTLAALDYRSASLAIRRPPNNEVQGVVTPNLYWQQRFPFEHANFGGYLVTRLDGYQEAEVRSLIDLGVAPHFLGGGVLIDPSGSNNVSGRPQPIGFLDMSRCTPQSGGSCPANPAYGGLRVEDFNQDQLALAEVLKSFKDLSVLVAPPNTFPTGTRLIAYVSWGSNDPAFNPFNYTGLTFRPGAIAETAVSTSARTFLPTRGGQSLVADLIRQGVTGVKGYSDEPFLDSVASPSVLLPAYLCGINLATAFYSASRFVNWRDIVVGDPLSTLEGNSNEACQVTR
ncbi:MAG: TIGR03790 family protein [Gemmatimonadaceae bacterium]|nr:TIGR03790 family protein [Gloeobacterales cyanobacterium ES-bin-141]